MKLRKLDPRASQAQEYGPYDPLKAEEGSFKIVEGENYDFAGNKPLDLTPEHMAGENGDPVSMIDAGRNADDYSDNKPRAAEYGDLSESAPLIPGTHDGGK